VNNNETRELKAKHFREAAEMCVDYYDVSYNNDGWGAVSALKELLEDKAKELEQ